MYCTHVCTKKCRIHRSLCLSPSRPLLYRFHLTRSLSLSLSLWVYVVYVPVLVGARVCRRLANGGSRGACQSRCAGAAGRATLYIDVEGVYAHLCRTRRLSPRTHANRTMLKVSTMLVYAVMRCLQESEMEREAVGVVRLLLNARALENLDLSMALRYRMMKPERPPRLAHFQNGKDGTLIVSTCPSVRPSDIVVDRPPKAQMPAACHQRSPARSLSLRSPAVIHDYRQCQSLHFGIVVARYRTRWYCSTKKLYDESKTTTAATLILRPCAGAGRDGARGWPTSLRTKTDLFCLQRIKVSIKPFEVALLCASMALALAQGPTTTPVPILKQINKQNDDGSYSYGYEAADGSFKIETKYPNGDVAGKYGYVDENGKLREISYGAGSKGGFEPQGGYNFYTRPKTECRILR
ncbi:Endocuticle structural glycoprotein ABD-4 [Eumeta japonica]|uniref:Endocuticle structural glycoprotein ABD-4 n=1 Tax=Eumeta variegata TaxID=151549 RepID=A0A4C1ZUV4_EUMVA|nr:Endocuticle structural glycoprotein ABD-4 [Eumeta japonica]